MALVDQLLVLAYLGLTVAVGLRRGPRSAGADTPGEYLLAGRALSLPAFVMTTVATWYGGILGVGEYTFRYGLSNWLVFGVPYYLAAALFAVFLAGRARRSQAMTLPEQLRVAYGPRTGSVAAVVVLLTTVPAAYVLMLGTLLRLVFGLPQPVAVVLGTGLTIGYLWRTGFRAVVRTDEVQFGLMFGGFLLIVGALAARHGFVDFLTAHVPASHWTWHGGNPPQAIFVWYLIALATLTAPAFYQRCFAARTPRVARTGLFVSIACWAVFDALTTLTGLYARALLTDLPASQAAEAFPRLAAEVLPPGLVGVFYVALFATVMSTLDSYLFLAASTFGQDLLGRVPRAAGRLTAATRLGLVLCGAAAAALALMTDSVVRLWHAFGSLGTAALVVPVVGAFVPRLRPSPRGALVILATSLAVTSAWLLSRTGSAAGAYWLGLEPIVAGLAVSGLLWLGDRPFAARAARRRLESHGRTD